MLKTLKCHEAFTLLFEQILRSLNAFVEGYFYWFRILGSLSLSESTGQVVLFFFLAKIVYACSCALLLVGHHQGSPGDHQGHSLGESSINTQCPNIFHTESILPCEYPEHLHSSDFYWSLWGKSWDWTNEKESL